MSEPSPPLVAQGLGSELSCFVSNPWRLCWMWSGLGKEWDGAVGSTGGFTSCCAARLGANTFPQSIPLSQRDVQAGQAHSQLLFSPDPPRRMPQLHLCPGVGVCWRRSRRWAEKSAGRRQAENRIRAPDISSIVFSVTELEKI